MREEMFTTPLPAPDERHPALVYDHQPELGDYLYSPSIDSWIQRRKLPSGRVVILRGRGRLPTPEQVDRFLQMDSQLAELLGRAILAIPSPPRGLSWGQTSCVPDWKTEDVQLSEIRLELDGTVSLLFETSLSKAIDMWPVVTFQHGEVSHAEWVC